MNWNKQVDLMTARDALTEAQRLVAKVDPDYAGSHNFEILLNHLACKIVDETMQRTENLRKTLEKCGKN